MRMLTISAVFVFCFGLSACAGTAGRNGLAHEDGFAPGVDYGKIVAVNQWAERRHAVVVWINYPVTARSRGNNG